MLKDGEYNANSVYSLNRTALNLEYLFENVNIKKRFTDGGFMFYT